jgi:hypothetical protein
MQAEGRGSIGRARHPDHVQECPGIPPKYGVSQVIGFLKGKSAVRIHRNLLGERWLTGLHFGATGYCVSGDEPRSLAGGMDCGELSGGHAATVRRMCHT